MLTLLRPDPAAIRDAVFILLGFASALCISGLGNLALDDLELLATGVLLHVRHSKTDPGRCSDCGRLVGVR